MCEHSQLGPDHTLPFLPTSSIYLFSLSLSAILSILPHSFFRLSQLYIFFIRKKKSIYLPSNSLKMSHPSCPGSPNDSSESDRSIDPCLIADGDWGVPTKCFCGERVHIDVDCNPQNFGLKFYACPNSGDGQMHINKFWDLAVDEEFKKIQLRMTEQDQKILNAFRDGGSASPVLESMKESLNEMRLEIEDLKEQLLKKNNEISRILQYLGIQ